MNRIFHPGGEARQALGLLCLLAVALGVFVAAVIDPIGTIEALIWWAR